MSPALIEALRDQYRAHPSWSAQLHYENLGALVEADPALGPMPSYATLTRAMRNRGLVRRRRRRRFEREPAPVAQTREVLSYEVERSHGLWHCLCGGHRYAAESRLCRSKQGNPAGLRNIISFIHMAFRKAISPLSSFNRRCVPGSDASQRASALAFISRSISA